MSLRRSKRPTNTSASSRLHPARLTNRSAILPVFAICKNGLIEKEVIEVNTLASRFKEVQTGEEPITIK